jgi:hypothetical protein
MNWSSFAISLLFMFFVAISVAHSCWLYSRYKWRWPFVVDTAFAVFLATQLSVAR